MKKALLLPLLIFTIFSCKKNEIVQPNQPSPIQENINLNRNAKATSSYTLFKVSVNGVDINLNPTPEVYLFENGGGGAGAGLGGGAQSNPFYKFSRLVAGLTVEKGDAQFVTTPDGNSYMKLFSNNTAFPNGSYTTWSYINYPTTTEIILSKRVGFTTAITLADRFGGLGPVADPTRYHYWAATFF